MNTESFTLNKEIFTLAIPLVSDSLKKFEEILNLLIEMLTKLFMISKSFLNKFNKIYKIVDIVNVIDILNEIKYSTYHINQIHKIRNYSISLLSRLRLLIRPFSVDHTTWLIAIIKYISPWILLVLYIRKNRKYCKQRAS